MTDHLRRRDTAANPSPATATKHAGDVVINPHALTAPEALTIDGEPFPWYISADKPITVNSRADRFMSVTITLLVSGTVTVSKG